MLHKIALAVSPETPTLIKEALPSREQQMAESARLEQKAFELAESRGVDIPFNETTYPDPKTGKTVRMQEPDIAGTRMSGNENAPKNRQEPVFSKDPQTGKTVGKPNVTPPPSKPGRSQLLEKEVIKAHGTVSQSPAKQLRHRTIGKGKRFLAGQGGLGSKLKNRGAVGLGLGALGLGINAYLDSNKARQPEEVIPPPVSSQEQQYMQQQAAQYHPYFKGASMKYVQDMANIPKPPSQPQVSAPGPGVSGVGKLKGGPGTPMGSGIGSGAGGMGSGADGGSGGKTAALSDFLLSSAALKKTLAKKTAVNALPGNEKAASEATVPMLAAGAGGLGGWALGEKLIAPALQQRESALIDAIARQEAILAKLKKARKAAPMGAAAAGAILLAALTAVKARQSERRGAGGVQITPHDPTGAGFAPGDQANMYPGNGGNPYGPGFY